MLKSSHREGIAAYLRSEPEIWNLLQTCVYRTPTKDEAAEWFIEVLQQNGIHYTSDGKKISKTAVRYAMQEIN